jgi:hypothetical protein
MGSGIHMTDAGFKVEEGVHQGAVPSGYLYSFTLLPKIVQFKIIAIEG